jgi:hypothetical protein
MAPKQHAHRIRQPHSLDARREPDELGLDLSDLGLGPGQLLADVLDLFVEPAFAGPNGSQRFIALVKLLQRLPGPLGQSRQLFQETLGSLVLALDLEPLQLLLGFAQLPPQGLVVRDPKRRAVSSLAEQARIVGSNLVLICLDLRPLYGASQRIELRKRVCRNGIGGRCRRAFFEIFQPLLCHRQQLGDPPSSLRSLLCLSVELHGLVSRRCKILLGFHELGVELGGACDLRNADRLALLQALVLLVDQLRARLCFLRRPLVLGGRCPPFLESGTKRLGLPLDLVELRRPLFGVSFFGGNLKRAALRCCVRRSYHGRQPQSHRDCCPPLKTSVSHRGFRIRIKPSWATEATSAPSSE